MEGLAYNFMPEADRGSTTGIEAWLPMRDTGCYDIGLESSVLVDNQDFYDG
jgi:hypothetical protein